MSCWIAVRFQQGKAERVSASYWSGGSRSYPSVAADSHYLSVLVTGAASSTCKHSLPSRASPNETYFVRVEEKIFAFCAQADEHVLSRRVCHRPQTTQRLASSPYWRSALRAPRTSLIPCFIQFPLHQWKGQWKTVFEPLHHHQAGRRLRSFHKTHLKKLPSMLHREHVCIEIGNPLLPLLRDPKVAQGISDIRPDFLPKKIWIVIS